MGTFYHTTNYNPLTGDLNNMVKPNKTGVWYDYNSENKTFKEERVAKKNPKHGQEGKYSKLKKGLTPEQIRILEALGWN